MLFRLQETVVAVDKRCCSLWRIYDNELKSLWKTVLIKIMPAKCWLLVNDSKMKDKKNCTWKFVVLAQSINCLINNDITLRSHAAQRPPVKTSKN